MKINMATPSLPRVRVRVWTLFLRKINANKLHVPGREHVKLITGVGANNYGEFLILPHSVY